MIVKDNNPYKEASFSVGNRLKRQMWDIVWIFLFCPSPRFFWLWRKLLLVIFGARLGRSFHIRPSVRVWAPWNLEVGDYVGIGDDVIIYSMDKISIGEYSVISQGSHLCTGSHDINSLKFQLFALPITIKPRVWLCAETFIGPGVEIAEGSVIGARGVVSKSIVEPWCIWAGVPVKKIGIRAANKFVSK